MVSDLPTFLVSPLRLTQLDNLFHVVSYLNVMHGYFSAAVYMIVACTKHRQDLGSTRYKSKKRKRKDVSALPAKKEAEHYFPHAGSKINFPESLAQGTSKNLTSSHMGDLSHVRHIQGGASLEDKEKFTVVKKSRSEIGRAHV